MANSSTPKNGYVKTQTLIFAVFLAFVAGFFSGIVLTILKSGGGTPAGVDAGTAAQVNEQRQMQDQIGQLEELTKRNPQGGTRRREVRRRDHRLRKLSPPASGKRRRLDRPRGHVSAKPAAGGGDPRI